MNSSSRRSALLYGVSAALFAAILYLATLCLGIDPGANLEIASGAAGYGGTLPLDNFLWIALLRGMHWLHPDLLILGPRIVAILMTLLSGLLMVRTLCWMRAVPPPTGLGLLPPPLPEIPSAAFQGACIAAIYLFIAPVLWQSSLVGEPGLAALLLLAVIIERLAAAPAQDQFHPLVVADLSFGLLVVLDPAALFLAPLVAWANNHALRRIGRFDFPAIATCLVVTLLGALAAIIALSVHMGAAQAQLSPSERLRIEQLGTSGPLAVYLAAQMHPLKALLASPIALLLPVLATLPLILIAYGRRLTLHYGLGFLHSWNRALLVLALPMGLALLAFEQPWRLAHPDRPALFVFWLTALWTGWLLQEGLLFLLPNENSESPKPIRWLRIASAVVLSLLLLLPAVLHLPRLDRTPIASAQPAVSLIRVSLSAERHPIGNLGAISDLVRFVSGTYGLAPDLVDLGRPRYAGQDRLLWQQFDRAYRGTASQADLESFQQLDLLASPQAMTAYHRPLPFAIHGLFYRPALSLEQLDAEAMHQQNLKIWGAFFKEWPARHLRTELTHANLLPVDSYFARVLNDLACILAQLNRTDFAAFWIEKAYQLDPDNPVITLNAHELCLPITHQRLAHARHTLASHSPQPSPDAFGYLIGDETSPIFKTAWADALFHSAPPAFSVLPSDRSGQPEPIAPSALLDFMGTTPRNITAPTTPTGDAPFEGSFEDAITRAQNLVLLDDPQNAEPFLAQVRRQFSGEPRLALIEAALAVVEKDWKRAEFLYRSVLDQSPRDRSARIGLAITLSQSSRPQESLDLLKPIIDSPASDQEAKALLPIGIDLAEQLERWDLCELWLRRIRDLYPGTASIPWLERLVVNYWRQGRMQRMEAACAELLALAPNSGTGILYQARAAHRRIDEARTQPDPNAGSPPRSQGWPQSPTQQATLLVSVYDIYEQGLGHLEAAFAFHNQARLALDLHRLEQRHPGSSSPPAQGWLGVALHKAARAVELESDLVPALVTLGQILVLQAASADQASRDAQLLEADRALERAADAAGANPSAELLLYRAQFHWLSSQTAIGDSYARQAHNRGLPQSVIDQARSEVR